MNSERVRAEQGTPPPQGSSLHGSGGSGQNHDISALYSLNYAHSHAHLIPSGSPDGQQQPQHPQQQLPLTPMQQQMIQTSQHQQLAQQASQMSPEEISMFENMLSGRDEGHMVDTTKLSLFMAQLAAQNVPQNGMYPPHSQGMAAQNAQDSAAALAGMASLAPPELLDENRYSCDHEGCTKAFSKHNLLARHKRTHTSKRPYNCSFPGCSKSFTQPGNLIEHARLHTGERPYPCDYPNCGKTFNVSSNLTRHKKTHSNTRSHKCDFPDCGKSFTQSGHLKKHKMIHTGDRPYVCDFEGCEKAFTQRAPLETHRRSHSNDRPFVCSVDTCHKGFFQRGDLTRHYRTHSTTSGVQVHASSAEQGMIDQDMQRGVMRHAPAPIMMHQDAQQDMMAQSSAQLTDDPSGQPPGAVVPTIEPEGFVGQGQ